MSFFDRVALCPADPILGLGKRFLEDPRKEKVNLGAGIYKDEKLSTPVMESVSLAEKLLLQKGGNKEYLPIDGDPLFINRVGELILGKDFWGSESKRVCGFQTPGGTGALRVGGTFLKKELNSPFFLSDPSWTNHKGVFISAGLDVGSYPYYDFTSHEIPFEKLLSFCKTLPASSVLLFHASCHNPTGLDLTLEQWGLLADVCIAKQLLPFFDCAYQGFGKGIDEDAASIRLFAKRSIQMLIAVSHSKNFSLYGERVGALYVVASSQKVAECVRSSIKQIIRVLYSNPPLHGAQIVGAILQDPKLSFLWLEELERMRQRIAAMRLRFVTELSKRVKHQDLSHMSRGNGLFCFTGLTSTQVEKIIEEYGVYMPPDGRINVCGLNSINLEHTVSAFTELLA